MSRHRHTGPVSSTLRGGWSAHLVPPSGGTPPTNTSLPTFSGTGVQGERLDGTDGGWSGTVTGYLHSVEYQAFDGSWVVLSTLSSYVPTATDVGRTLRYRVRAYGPGGTSAYALATNTVVVTAPPPPPPPPPPAEEEKATGRPAFATSQLADRTTAPLDTYEPGHATDTDATTRWASVNGVNGESLWVDLEAARLVKRVETDWFPAAFATQYEVSTSLTGGENEAAWTTRATRNITAGGLDIAPFTEVTARFVRIKGITRSSSPSGISIVRLTVYGTDDADPSFGVGYVNTRRPAITGDPHSGSTVTCDSGTWTDELGNQLTRIVPKFQWYLNGTVYGAATTTPSLLLTDAMVGKVVAATVNVGGDGGTTVQATGSFTAQAKIIVPPPVQKPTLVSAPQIAGSGKVGDTLTVTAQAQWNNSPTSTFSAWTKSTDNVTFNDVSPADNDSVYTPSAVGYYRVRQTATNSAGTSDPAYSNTIQVVAATGTRSAWDYPFATHVPGDLSKSSPWTRGIGDGATYGSMGVLNGGAAVIDAHDWSIARFLASNSDPVLTIWDDQHGGNTGVQIHVPTNAAPSGQTTDGHVCVVDPTQSFVDEFWVFSRSGSQLHCDYWVRSYIKPGTYNGVFKAAVGWGGGVRAAFVSTLAGLTTLNEAKNRLVQHPLPLILPSNYTSPSNYVWPATSWDSYHSSYSGSIKLGSLLAIPTVAAGGPDFNTMGLNQDARYLADILRNCGAYFVDTEAPNNGSNIKLNMAPEVDGTSYMTNYRSAWSTLRPYMAVVTNNSQTNPGGPGTTRLMPDPTPNFSP